MWEKVKDGIHLDTHGLTEATKDQQSPAKADITSIMKTNGIALSLLGSMGILRAFPV